MYNLWPDFRGKLTDKSFLPFKDCGAVGATGLLPVGATDCCDDGFIEVGKVAGAEEFLEMKKYVIAPRATTSTNIKTIFFWFICLEFMIKKFSSPKIKIWFEPMFFSGFFCGFERYGSPPAPRLRRAGAAFPNFRGGNFPEKCVRTNSRILRQTGKVKGFWFASLRSATNLYSIFGEKTNWRFRILGEENFLILNPQTI
ncbi:hypothetical protein A3B85_00470 [Candidatus Nomurabacteria bacterium RIFCSPHIGHO2_02_FULL_37_13]|uniref:Uncharacterized protein n=1 Tax=Candidatus Nomurabacteria bacterium RIFCSPHIGHO2_02_FULL_37_13 TaxID=1801750 RepID=A0A1F6W4D9_9BACT|nr:MAG: hypothetical protein A3B85_00470 [Candidatus Nomurabacteria bacterium RIFCSPHIGHO2_02_FULL_37_13]